MRDLTENKINHEINLKMWKTYWSLKTITKGNIKIIEKSKITNINQTAWEFCFLIFVKIKNIDYNFYNKYHRFLCECEVSGITTV